MEETLSDIDKQSNDRCRLLCDKYRPLKLNKMDFNIEVSNKLRSYSRIYDSIGHILIYGPISSGKYTRIMSFLKKIYGIDIWKKKNCSYTINLKKDIVYDFIHSQYHYEFDLQNYSISELHNINKVFDNLGDSSNIVNNSFRIIIVRNIDLLPQSYQSSLLFTMEKCINTLRFIFITSKYSKLLNGLRNRCIQIINPSPTKKDIKHILQIIIKKENATINYQIINKIIKYSFNVHKSYNLILSIELLSNVLNGNKLSSLSVPGMTQLLQLVEFIKKYQLSIDKLSLISINYLRSLLYDLYSLNIKTEYIFNYLIHYISSVKTISDTIKIDIIHSASIFEHKSVSTHRKIIVIEAFIIDCLQKLSV
jgi:replication factor C subunit 3/5